MISSTKKIDYGILLMASLPECGEKQFRSLQDIAEEKKLSAGFLSQLMMPLKKAGLVKSKEGIHGGYQLKKPSSFISVSEIIEALEGPLCLTTCQGFTKTCVCEKKCPSKNLWVELQSLLRNYLSNRYLSEFRTLIFNFHESSAFKDRQSSCER